MKKRMLSLCMVLLLIIAALPLTASAADEVEINKTNFPDPIFRSYVSENFDLNGDLLLDSNEIAAVTSLDLSNTQIADLQGIKFFPLTSLDVNGCTDLYILDCSYISALVSLDVSGCTALQILNCSNTQLTDLDVNKCTVLQMLNCNNTKLVSLNVSGCVALTDLDVSRCTALQDLRCDNTQLTDLDASECTALQDLYCYNTQLTDLDVSRCTALQTLDCDNTQLTNLDVSRCVKLISLYCHNNQLTDLDVSGCTALQVLDCSDTWLTGLDVSGCTALQVLKCYYSQLTKLDLIKKCGTLIVDSQTSSSEIKKISGEWTVNLTELVGAENLNKVKIKEGQAWQYDAATGLASYTGEGVPDQLVYYYNGNNFPAQKMDVTVELFEKEVQPCIVMKQDAEQAYVNGIVAPTTQYASGYAKPKNINGTMQLPLRYIAEVNGFTVNYDENTGKTAITNPEDGTYLLITPNSTTVTKHTADGTQIDSSDAPLAFSIENGITMGPLRFTCEALGLAVSYQETSHGIYIVISQRVLTDEDALAKIEKAYQLGL